MAYLSNYARRLICEDIIRDSCDEAEAWTLQEEFTLADEIYFSVTEPLREAIEMAPEGLLCENHILNIRPEGGRTACLRMPKERPFPFYYDQVVTGSFKERLLLWERHQYENRQNRDGIYAEVLTEIEKFRSVQKLRNTHPEWIKFMPAGKEK